MKTRAALIASSALVAVALLSATASAAPPDPDLVKRGQYLATAGDCVACHTTPGGKPFAGGLAMATPFGNIISPNITPDQTTGIGAWTDDQFYRAMHEGIDDQGHYLYPAYPFPWYTKVTRDDVQAIKAYLFSLPPEHNDLGNRLQLAFPFNVREALLTWRLAFFRAGTFQPDPAQSAEINRGAYLVQGLGHCGECHNGNSLMGASDWSGRLQGGKIEGYYAPNLTSDPHQGIGTWTTEQLVTFLKNGAAPGKGAALGPMQETIHDSLSHLSDADLTAMALYLKSIPSKATYTPVAAAGDGAVTAEATYGNFCASCHGATGQGQHGVVPALAGNGAVTAAGPENVISVVLGGLQAQHGLAPMPAVGAGMTDQQVADAVNYARQAWGNAAPATAGPGAVGKLRATTQTMLALNLPGGCAEMPQNATAITADPVVATALQGVTSANMLERIGVILPHVKSAAPALSADDVTNAMTAAYCPIVLHDPSIPAAERPIQLGTWAELVYGQLKGGALAGGLAAGNGG